MYKLIAFVFLTICPLAMSQAADGNGVRQFIDTTGKQVLGVLNANSSEEAKQKELRQLFANAVDMDWMGKFVLGQGGRKATPEQRAQYQEAYRNYLLARYTTNFSEYSNSKYIITSVKPAADNQFLVGMDIQAPNTDKQEIRAGYRVRNNNGSYKIVDIIVEGVSLLTTQRSEFASVIQRQGMDSLINSLKEKSNK